MWAWALRIAGSTAVKWAIGALVAAAAVLAVRYNYVPRADYKELERQVELMNAHLVEQQTRLDETRDLYREEQARTRELHRHFDNIRTRLREIDDEDTRNWRAARVPDPVARGLRDLAPRD